MTALEVAVYKGDEFVCMGTIKECAEFMGVKKDTIRYYLRPAYSKKIAKRKKSPNAITVIKLDDDDEQ